MDASQLILSLIKDEHVRCNVNPIVYYSLKLIYSAQFAKRSRYFGRAIKRLYDDLGSNMNIQLNNYEEMNLDSTITFDMALDNLDKEGEGEGDAPITGVNGSSSSNLNVTVNKNNFNSVNKLMKTDWKWCFNHLVEYDDEYILDKNDDYILLTLLTNYIFGDEPAHTSTLMLCYNLFASSIELMFCFQLILNVPKYYLQKKEQSLLTTYIQTIHNRVNEFFTAWAAQFPSKREKNKLIKHILSHIPVLPSIEHISPLYQTQLTMSEPILNSKYISFTKLIKEGPFCFEIDEIARQICLIDHEELSSLTYKDFTEFVVKREIPKSFDKFFIREKQLQCYILIFITMHNNLENKKIMIQHFISLANTLKLFNNQQTCNTIISTFYIVGITKKKLLWKLIEKKYRDIYSTLEKELNDIELNESTVFRDKKDEPMVMHIKHVISLVNNIVIQMKGVGDIGSEMVCEEYKRFIMQMNDNAMNKYAFFKLNPLYDFFKFGFVEISKPKRWNLKLRFDFSGYFERLDKLDQLLNYLIKTFQNLDI
jgi:hypothetical protein